MPALAALFAGVAAKSGHAIKELPYAFISPEWSNEKGLCAALAFRLLGMNSYHSVYAPTQGSEKVNRVYGVWDKKRFWVRKWW